MNVKRLERGWAGHFILSRRCMFRRNTLLTKGSTKIIVSTVGSMLSEDKKKMEEIGYDRNYETMVFYSSYDKYDDSDVSREITDFKSNWALSELDDIKANDMHETVVNEIANNLENGIYETKEALSECG